MFTIFYKYSKIICKFVNLCYICDDKIVMIKELMVEIRIQRHTGWDGAYEKTIKIPDGIKWFKDDKICHGGFIGKAYNYSAIIPHSAENDVWCKMLSPDSEIQCIDFKTFYFIFLEGVVFLSDVEYVDELVFPKISILVFDTGLDAQMYTFVGYMRPICFIGGGEMLCEKCINGTAYLRLDSTFPRAIPRASHEIGTFVLYDYSNFVKYAHTIINAPQAETYKNAVCDIINSGDTHIDFRYGHMLWKRLNTKTVTAENDIITMTHQLESEERQSLEKEFEQFLRGEIVQLKKK